MLRLPTAGIGWMLATGATLWAAALFLAGISAGRPEPGPAEYIASTLVYAAGSVVCHQWPERSFHLHGAPLPVCARCTGIYVAAAIAALLAALRASSLRPAVQNGPERRALLASALPTAITLVVEWTSGAPPSNWIRAWAGASLGAAVGWIVVTHATSRVAVEVN